MHSAKHLVHSVVSKDEKLMKEIKAALNTPVGSVKRKMASKKLNILMKAARNRIGYDGMGGVIAPTAAQLPEPEKQKKLGNVVILHEPTRRKSPGQEQQGQQQTQQNPSFDPARERLKAVASSMFLNYPGRPMGQGDIPDGMGGAGGPETKGQWLTSRLKSGWEALASGVNTLADKTYANLQEGLKGSQERGEANRATVSNVAEKTAGTISKYGSPTGIANTGVLPAVFDVPKTIKTVWNSPVSTPKKPVAAPDKLSQLQSNVQTSQDVNKDVDAAKASLRQTGGMNWGEVWNNIKTKYPNKTNAEIDTLLERDKYYVPGTWDLVNPASASYSTTESVSTTGATDGATADTTSADTTGTGPTTYAQNMIAAYSGKPEAMKNALFSDKERMAQFLGVDSSIIPDNLSPLVSQMNADVEEQLRKETGLDEQRKAIFNRVYSGVNIQKDLENYVANKDEYIKTIDDQMRSAVAWRATQDMSNPYVADSVNNYFSYLEGLKTNQEKRYIDLVNDSVNQYENTNKQLELLYQETYTDFSSQLTKETNKNTEWYNKMNKMIDEMYEYVLGADQRTVDSLKMKQELLDLNKEMANKTINEYISGGNDVIDHYTHYQKYFSDDDSVGLGESQKIANEVDSNEVKNYIYIPTFDIASTLQNVASQKIGDKEYLKPASLITVYSSKISNDLPKLIDVNETGAINSEKRDSLNTAMNIYTNNILNLFNTDSSDADTKNAYENYAYDLASNLITTVKKNVANDLVNDQNSKNNIIAALKNLVAPKHKIFGSDAPQTVDEIKAKLPAWKTQYSQSINKSILNAIEQYVLFALPTVGTNPVNMFSAAMGVKDVNVAVDTLDNLTPAQIAEIISTGYMKPLFPILQK